jgi:hypothetical protein
MPSYEATRSYRPRSFSSPWRTAANPQSAKHYRPRPSSSRAPSRTLGRRRPRLLPRPLLQSQSQSPVPSPHLPSGGQKTVIECYCTSVTLVPRIYRETNCLDSRLSTPGRALTERCTRSRCALTNDSRLSTLDQPNHFKQNAPLYCHLRLARAPVTCALFAIASDQNSRFCTVKTGTPAGRTKCKYRAHKMQTTAAK